jgi:type VI secretion system protein
MAARGLLSRIASGAGPADEIGSILEHLRALLNTRQGDSPCAPRYGVLDFSDVVHALPGAVPALLQAMRATIAEYEPRLKAVSVRHLPVDGELVLRFEVSAQLARPGSGARTLRFATTVLPGGHVDVEG